MLRQLQELVDGLKGSEWAYGWMPLKQVEAVVALLHATAYHSVGKLAGCRVHLARAEEVVNEGLQQHEFELQVGACWLAGTIRAKYLVNTP